MSIISAPAGVEEPSNDGKIVEALYLTTVCSVATIELGLTMLRLLICQKFNRVEFCCWTGPQLQGEHKGSYYCYSKRECRWRDQYTVFCENRSFFQGQEDAMTVATRGESVVA